MRKFLSVLLAVVMMLSLSVTAFAAEDDLVIAPAPTDVVMPIAAPYAGTTVILHSNDVHGNVEGYAYMAAAKTYYETKGAEVILVDAGDFSQGTTYVSTTKGADAIDMMNAVGYDFVTLGNHEFDYGYAQLKENMAGAEFKVLCANVLENGKPVFDANCTYTTESGVKIGFFGLETPEAQTKANPALIKGLTFLAGDELFACAQKQVDAMKDDDIVICLSHLGVDDESKGNQSYDLYANTTGIDMIIDGHSHTVMTEGKNGEPIQSTGTAFANIGIIIIDNATKTIEDSFLYPITEESEKNEDVAAAAKTIVDRVNAEYGEVFAKSEIALNGAKAPNGNRDSETNNGDLITDAMVWQVMKNKSGLTVPAENVVAITNGGGIRAAINPGDISKKDINTVLPFGNTVAVVYVTGAELLEALEASTYCTPNAVGGFPQVSGIEFKLDTTKAYDANAETYPGSTYYGPASINRVTITGINGKAFDPKATYAVVTNNFCAAGGDTYYAFAAASAQFDTGVPLDEAVMAYITDELGGVVGEKYAEPQGRITIKVNPFTDASTSAWYYDAVDYCVENGLMKGTSDTTFTPNGITTRAQVVTVLYNMAKAAGNGFTGAWAFPLDFTDAADVPEWAYEATAWCSMNKIVEGYDGKFDPNAPITREQFAIILYRYAEFMKVDIDEITKDTNTLSYEDIRDISSWAATGVHFCIAADIIGGDENRKINPQNTTTRVEMAAMLQRYCENVAK